MSTDDPIPTDRELLATLKADVARAKDDVERVLGQLAEEDIQARAIRRPLRDIRYELSIAKKGIARVWWWIDEAERSLELSAEEGDEP